MICTYINNVPPCDNDSCETTNLVIPVALRSSQGGTICVDTLHYLCRVCFERPLLKGISELEQSPYPYVLKIQDKVKELLAQHRSSIFDTWLEQDKISCLPNYAFPSVISPTGFITMVPKSLYTAEEQPDNNYEFKVIWALSELDNVKWWHRNISKRGFQINGPVHAYPDIIVMLHSGKILMVETKGEQLDNDESKEKAKIGDQWARLAGKQYKYYMVFESKQPDYPGAYSLERFMEIVKGL